MIQDCPIGYMGGRSFIPIVAMPKKFSDFDPVYKRICELGGKYRGREKFRVMIGELTDNIYQHSQFDNALVMAQHYPNSGYMEICIMDDGITIAGSLRNAGMIMEDHEALNAAVEGLSSKEEAGRGFGLGESILTLTGDFNARVLLVSGRAILHFERGEQKAFMLRDSWNFKGTLISIDMPVHGEEDASKQV